MSLRSLARLLLLALFWGSSFLLLRIAVREIEPVPLIILRHGLGALFVGVVVWAQRLPMPRGGRAWLVFATMGMLNAGIPQIIIAWSLRVIDSGLGTILFAAAPLCSAVLGQVFLEDEHLGVLGVIGLLIGFAGVGLVIGGGALQTDTQHLLGMIGVLVGAFLSGSAGVFARRAFLLRDIHPLVGATGQMAATSTALLPLLLSVNWPLRVPSVTTVAALVGLAFFCTAIAFVLYYKLLSEIGATRTMTVTYLMPIVAVCWGVFLAGEHVSLSAILGLGLVLLGITLATRQRAQPSVVQGQASAQL